MLQWRLRILHAATKTWHSKISKYQKTKNSFSCYPSSSYYPIPLLLLMAKHVEINCAVFVLNIHSLQMPFFFFEETPIGFFFFSLHHLNCSSQGLRTVKSKGQSFSLDLPSFDRVISFSLKHLIPFASRISHSLQPLSRLAADSHPPVSLANSLSLS